MALRAIKDKIRSVDRTRKVTKAMEAVSAVKMRTSQMRALSGRPYARAAVAVLERLSAATAHMRHPLTRVRPVERVLLVVITSDKGLAGALNASVLREAEKTIAGLSMAKERIEILALGKKAKEYFGKRGYTLAASYENVSDTVSIADVSDIANTAIAGFDEARYDQVSIVYTNFYSTFEQKAVESTLLPLSIESARELVESIVPEKGKFADTAKPALPAAYTVEPVGEDILDTLMPKLVSVMVYHALNESKASEHSARMVAMKNASDKSLELSRNLTRQYNKARQAAITSEVSEIVGGIEAMAGN